MGLSNEMAGYAPDRMAAARGGYAAETVPMMFGEFAFASVHEDLVAALLEEDAAQQA